MYRRHGEDLEVLLVHPGGPLWRHRDEGAWSAPKGEIEPDEEALSAAVREFREETGIDPGEPFLELSPIRQKGGKVVRIWAFQGDGSPAEIRSNTFKLEWPPHSGEMQEFPEIDRAAFFGITEARRKINPAQIPLLDELVGKAGPPSS